MAQKPLSPTDSGWDAFVFFEQDGWYYREITGKRRGPYATDKLAVEALKEYLQFLHQVDIANYNRTMVAEVIQQMQADPERTPWPRPNDKTLASLDPARSVYGRLDPDKKTDARLKFEQDMTDRVIGQERAIRVLSRVYSIAEAGVSDPDRPFANLMFLGPTGVGKTLVVEAMAESLFGTRTAMVKISCAEYQSSHEIAKILGAPPGYIGYRESKPILTKATLEAHWKEGVPRISLLLFDEIEKASPEMWQLLLGIMDKGEFTMGSGEIVNLSRCCLVLTGNVGTSEMSSILSGGMGFSPSGSTYEGTQDDQIYRAALAAAKRKFPPEFMNRLDRTVVFRTLTPEGLEMILDIEVRRVWNRIMRETPDKTILRLTAEARSLLIKEGTDPKFGARPLRRTVERFLLYPLATFISTRQLYYQCILVVDKEEDKDKLFFTQTELPRIEQPPKENGVASKTSD
jgi:ATP-dependent Clp protease ATP-binding subunit ClpB